MRFGSVCSGIEAASVAWEKLGWQAAWLAEIEKFPSQLLAQRYPGIKNLGDMRGIAKQIRRGSIEAPDILVGGTPCQAFSIAGLRNSLDDIRGQLTLHFLDLANAIDEARAAIRLGASVIVWENVPGVLTSRDNAFGCFLAGLAGEDEPLEPPGKKWTDAGCVYGPSRTVAWRCLDAQYFGLAQRRKRVFVIASARAGFDPAKVLFEFDGVRRDSSPSRETAEVVAATIDASDGRRRGSGMNANQIVATLDASYARLQGCSGQDAGHSHLVIQDADSVSRPLTANGQRLDFETETFVVHGTQDPCVSDSTAFALGRNNGAENVIAFSCKDYGGDAGAIAPTLRAMNSVGSRQNGGGQIAVAFAENSRAEVRIEGGDGQIVGTLSAGGGKPGQGTPTIAGGSGVRRLMPSECEALQGFPRGHTAITINGKTAADSPRYKALGNSMAITVMRWIGARINAQRQA